MGDLIWRGDAAAVAQVVKIVPSDPEAGDRFIITINGKTVTFTADEDTATVGDVVDGLVAAWNAATFPEATAITAERPVDGDGNGLDYLELTANEAGVPFRVETSTEDAGGFSVSVSTLQDGSETENEIQQIEIPSPNVSGGTFTVTFSGQTTAAIAFDATAAAVQTALESLSNIVAGDVVVSGDAGGPWTVEFAQNYAGVNVPLMTADGTNLTGAAAVSIQTTTPGDDKTNEVQRIDYSGGIDAGGDDKLTITDPISGGTQVLSFGLTWGRSLWQSAFNNALGFLGTGGQALVTEVDDDIFDVEFYGTWEGLDVPLMIDGGFSPGITEQQKGSATGTNEVQRVALTWGPTGGTFTLSLNGNTTAAIAFDATAAAVQSAIEAALTGAGNCSVTGNDGGPWDVEFIGTWGELDVSQMTGDGSSLTGGTVLVSTTQESDPGANEIQQIQLNPTPEGGTFTLSIDLGSGLETTGAIAFDATAGTVETAIEGLASVVAGDVVVSGDAGGPWVVEFAQNFATTVIQPFTGDGDNLTGGGAQDLTLETTTRSGGPNHFDDPDNWTGEAVPGALDNLFFSGGAVDCLWGLRQMVDFTADAGTDLLTFSEPADFVEGQKVRLFTTDTLPAGLSTGTDYFVLNLDYDAGTCQLETSLGGGAVNITDAGTGTHTVALHIATARFHSRWTGLLGLTERDTDGEFYEYRPRGLAAVINTVVIGEGDGDGQGRLDFDTGAQPVAITVHQTGGSNEPGLPAIRWKGANAANTITVYDGEFGVAIYATETATANTLELYSGLVQIGTATLSGITKHGGELTAENVTLSGPLALHG